jgi:hypothetical protein
LKKIILPFTEKCAREIGSSRMHIAEQEEKEIARLERIARINAKKKFNATMFPNPIKREERQKAFMKAEDLKAKANAYMDATIKNSELPIDPKAIESMKREEENMKAEARHAEEFAKGQTSAEEFGKWKEKLKTLKLRAEKSRLKAVQEENKKFKLKSEASDIIAKHLKEMRAAYSKGNDRVANSIATNIHQNAVEHNSKWSENVEQAVVQDAIKAQEAPVLIPPYNRVFEKDLKGTCTKHFALRMVHLQKLVGRTAGHVSIMTDTLRKLHGKHLEEMTMLVATVRAQDAAVKHLQEALVLFKNNPDSTSLGSARVMAAKEALKTAGISLKDIKTLNYATATMLLRGLNVALKANAGKLATAESEWVKASEKMKKASVVVHRRHYHALVDLTRAMQDLADCKNTKGVDGYLGEEVAKANLKRMANVKRDSYKRLVAAAKKAIQTRSVEAIEHGTAIESTQEAAKGELALENARKTFKKAIVGAAHAHELAKNLLMHAKKNVESGKKWFNAANASYNDLKFKTESARAAIVNAKKNVDFAAKAGLMHDMRGVWTLLERLAVAHLASLQNRVVDVQLTVDAQKKHV